MHIEEISTNLLNSLPSAAAVVDRFGTFVITNKAWNDQESPNLFFCTSSEGNYFEYCREATENGSDDALKMILGLRKILDGEIEKFESTCSLKTDGSLKWFKVNIRPYENDGAIIFIEEITQNISAVNALRDSNERYQQQFNYSVNGIIIGTPDGDIIDANPAACSILGYSRKQLIEGGRSIVLDEENPYNKKAAKIRSETSTFEGEKRYINSSGEELSVYVSSVLFRDMDGNFVTINTFRNISKEKQIERKLKNEQEFSKAAIDSIPGAFYVLDMEGNFLQWNKTFLNEIGYTEHELEHIKPADFFPEDEQLKLRKKLKNVLVNGKAEMVGSLLTKKNGIRKYKLNARSFTRENQKYIVGTGVDITDLIEAKAAKELNHKMMSQLFDNSPFGIVLIDENNKVSRANEGFMEMFQYRNGDLMGKNVNDLIALEECRSEAENISKKAFNGTITQTESVRYKKDGTKVPVLLNTVPVSNKGKVIAVYGIYVDLTEQKKLEEQITELFSSEKEARQKAQSSLGEKEILLQEVHHRVKNNLAVIAGLLDLQLMEENDQSVYKKLSEVQSRIFSIAKIHETLYQEKNVVHIRFDNYLKSFVHFLPQQGFDKDSVSEINLQCDEAVLNLNQAVPAGLMINELLNIVLPESPDESINIRLASKEKHVEIQLRGDNLDINYLIQNRKDEQFQFKLVEILLDQLNGTMNLDPNLGTITVGFEKTDAKGSSNSFIE